MSELANRLVELGAEKIANRNKKAWKHSDDVQYRLESRDVVAAVLRELERYAIEETDENWLHALDLDELAEVVEKGEQQ